MEAVTAPEVLEYRDSHPLVSLVSACFWVICELILVILRVEKWAYWYNQYGRCLG